MKAIWKAILLIVLFVYLGWILQVFEAASFWSALVGAFAALGVWGTIGTVLGLAYLIDPEETTEFVEQAAEDFFTIVGSAAGAVAGALFSNPLVLLAGGVALFFLFGAGGRRDDKRKDQPAPAISGPRTSTT